MSDSKTVNLVAAIEGPEGPVSSLTLRRPTAGDKMALEAQGVDPDASPVTYIVHLAARLCTPAMPPAMLGALDDDDVQGLAEALRSFRRKRPVAR